MDEATRLAIMRAMLGQGLLGGTSDIQKLQPVWQNLDVEAQMGGMNRPQPFEQWYQAIQQQMPELWQ